MKTDAQIQKDVMEELKWQPFLTGTEIGVAVNDGIVKLSGSVDTYSKKKAAENAVKKVAGVKAVAEDIEVNFGGVNIYSDSAVAAAVANALKWHSAVKEDKITIRVEDGVVTLDGEVDWAFQKNSAQLMIENLLGVRAVINAIKITPKGNPLDVKKRITEAFHRNATLDSQRIKIEIIGNKVILRGKVRSWAEKDDAGNAAWLAPGIDLVDNELEVSTDVFAY